MDEINGGILLVNCVGHGAEDFWADEGIFEAVDIAGLHNGEDGPNYPMVVGMTCLNGYFTEAPDGWDSLTELLAKSADKGAVAVFASSGMTTPMEQVLLDTGLFEALFADGTKQLGEVVSGAKRDLLESMEGANGAVGTFVLFGKPALEVKVQTSGPPGSSGSGEGCFIATAAYGSHAGGNGIALRKFRDQCLLLNGLGRSLIPLYYRYSPRLAMSINEKNTLKSVTRMGLSPLVGLSMLFGWVDLAQRWSLLVTMAMIISVLFYMELLVRRQRSLTRDGTPLTLHILLFCSALFSLSYPSSLCVSRPRELSDLVLK